MANSYYATDRVLDMLLMALIVYVLYIWCRRAENKPKKDGASIQCKACARRGGAYRPEFCRNCNCKFYN